MPVSPESSEIAQRNEVFERVLQSVKTHRVIRMADPQFAGRVGEFSYLFEGEDDLLHIAITRVDGGGLLVEDAQQVVSFLLPALPVGVVWLKPGAHSQHFYFGHDELLPEER